MYIKITKYKIWSEQQVKKVLMQWLGPGPGWKGDWKPVFLQLSSCSFSCVCAIRHSKAVDKCLNYEYGNESALCSRCCCCCYCCCSFNGTRYTHIIYNQWRHFVSYKMSPSFKLAVDASLSSCDFSFIFIIIIKQSFMYSNCPETQTKLWERLAEHINNFIIYS